MEKPEEEDPSSSNSGTVSENDPEPAPAPETGNETNVLLVWIIAAFACIMLGTLMVTQRKRS